MTYGTTSAKTMTSYHYLPMIMAALSACEDLIRLRVSERRSYDVISSELQQLYPAVRRGLSSRTIRRFCSDRNIHYSSGICSEDLNTVVESNVSQVITTLARTNINSVIVSRSPDPFLRVSLWASIRPAKPHGFPVRLTISGLVSRPHAV